MKRYIRSSIDLGGYSKYYILKKDGEMPEGERDSIADGLEGYEVTHLGWAVAKPEYQDTLADLGYDVLEYLKEGGHTFLGYVVKDRLYSVSMNDIEEALHNEPEA